MRVPGIALFAAAFCGIALLASEVSSKPFTEMQKRWWAFQKVVKPSVPQVRGQVSNPIDAFILSKLEHAGITPNPPADRAALIRRAYLDLVGLPPSAEEVRQFVSDTSANAWEKVVDRLLASPHYGERWARHWLDLARYADSAGFKSDETRPNIWRYRDYVIRSLNEDKPYDRFIREQIAGDELYPGNADALVATGFNRLFPDESNARDLFQRRQELLNDITDTVGAAFLGLTYGCARCHDHKFDPILHKDYYRLQAFFANTRIEDSRSLMSDSERREYEEKYAAWDGKTLELRAEMRKLAQPMMDARYKDEFEKYPEEIQEAIKTAPEQRTPIQWQMYHKSRWLLDVDEEYGASRLKGDAKTRYMELKAEVAKFDFIKPPDKPIAAAMIDNDAKAPATFVLRGGAHNAPMYEVQPGFLSILDPADAKIAPVNGNASTGRRAALANWLADPSNPLTTRVIVNRVWHYHFGRGISGTPSDFGVMGERPANKELLEWLTANFVENGWSLKKLHKLIMMSHTYRQSSAWRKDAAEKDPDNKLVWHWNRRRLEGETIRDSILQVGGLLNTKMGGPGVFPPMPPGVETRGGWKKNEDPQEALRRSVYIFVRRNTRYPMFEAFDMPDSHESCARRNTTVSPSQSLELMNNELVLQWSQGLAGRVLNDKGITLDAATDRAWKLAFGRSQSAGQRAAAAKFFHRHVPILEARAARGETLVTPASIPEGMTPAEAAAVVDFCHMLVNSNEFLYLN